GPRLRLAPADYDNRRLAANTKKIAQRGWDQTVPEDMIYLDNPDHRDLRRITARSFTSAYCRTMASNLARLATDVVEGFECQLADGASVDLVEGLAVKLPLATICEMMGLAPDDWQDIHRWTDALVDLDSMRWVHDGETRRDMRKRLHKEFYDYVDGIIEDRRASPTDDLSSTVVHGRVHGRELTDQELHGYLKLLITAGNETTRNAVSRGVLALLERPDQIALFESDPDRWCVSLVEEVVRFTSPVIQFARTTSRDAVLAGQAIEEGQTVGIWYPSANRDERVFERPNDLDITRDPNPHLGFGRGVHFCLGANLARFELRALFRVLGHRRVLSRLEVSGAACWLSDLHVGTIAQVPVRLTGAAH
ncbi:MAG: cytochrome P450, partial [Chromatiales bacterium]|nr:cytochrome P450 [Chromatiales bacterium]